MHHTGLNRDDVEQLSAIIARLDAKANHDYDDRRQHPRIDFSHPMWLNLPAAPGQPWVHVYSRNLSTSGLAFLTRALFYAGQHLVISHELKEQTPMLVLCEVCYCRPVTFGIQEVSASASSRSAPIRDFNASFPVNG